jgi:hypothetical protein
MRRTSLAATALLLIAVALFVLGVIQWGERSGDRAVQAGTRGPAIPPEAREPAWVQLPNLPIKVPALYAGREPRKSLIEAVGGGRYGGSENWFSEVRLQFHDPASLAQEEHGDVLKVLQGRSALFMPPCWIPVDLPGYSHAEVRMGHFDETDDVWRVSLLVFADDGSRLEFPFVSTNFDVETYSGIFYLQKSRQERYFRNARAWGVMVFTPVYYRYPAPAGSAQTTPGDGRSG